MAVNQHAAREMPRAVRSLRNNASPATGNERLCYENGKPRAPAARGVALGYAHCVCARASADKSVAPLMGLFEPKTLRGNPPRPYLDSDLATSAFLASIGVGRGGSAPHHDPLRVLSIKGNIPTSRNRRSYRLACASLVTNQAPQTRGANIDPH